MIQGIKNVYHLVVAVVANICYGFPSKSLFIIGVTGTDGKTTTVNLIYHILKENGYNAGMISTIGADTGGKSLDTGLHVTTPDPFLLQKILRKSVNAGVTHFVLEVTSHGLDQNRVWGIHYNVGIITNVTPEHLDYHKTYSRYIAAKMKLLIRSDERVVNIDDMSYKTIGKKFTHHVTTFGLSSQADINPDNFSFTTHLSGDFNKYNILAAAAAVRLMGLQDSQIRNAIATFQVPLGRQNIVYDKDFRVMIDFAHTPNSIRQVLKSIRPQVKGRIIHVFGSAGERDAYKRPKMGKASSEYADVIILTAEDPRSESVEKIDSEIAEGIAQNFVYSNGGSLKTYEKVCMQISDREEAIAYAIRLAQKGDMVVITGKGHEQSMNLGYGEEAWDERKVVEKAIKRELND